MCLDRLCTKEEIKDLKKSFKKDTEGNYIFYKAIEKDTRRPPYHHSVTYIKGKITKRACKGSIFTRRSQRYEVGLHLFTKMIVFDDWLYGGVFSRKHYKTIRVRVRPGSILAIGMDCGMPSVAVKACVPID